MTTPPVATSTTVLRLSTEARYQPEQRWQSIRDNAGPVARRWLQQNVPAHMQRQVRDMWGMQMEAAKGGGKAVVTAMLRVETSIVQSVLALSGQDAWFVEPLRWDQSDVPSCDVNWIKRSKDEPGHEYLARVRAMTGNLGVAKGWKGLGVRVPRAPNAQPKARVKTWKVTGVPRDWGHECVAKELEASGLSSLQLTSRRGAGRTTTLFFTAQGAEGADYVELQYGGNTVIATAFNPSQKPTKRENSHENAGWLELHVHRAG